MLARAAVLAAALAAFAAAPAMAWDHGGRGDRDAVYTQTNNPAGNTVVVFDRHHNGTLTQSAVVPTGGTGTASQPPFGFPIVDSQDSVKLTDDGRLLFVVNSGDNSVSSFRVGDRGLRLADHFVLPAGNVLPVSLAASGHVLYVLNGLSGNIYGMRFDSRGDIWGIPGSSQLLSSGPGPTGIAADIGFAPGGRVLAVSERCYDLSAVAPPFVGCPGGNIKGIIDTFAVDWRGVAGPAQEHLSSDFGPFGFAFLGRHLEVTNTGFVGQPFTPANPGNPALFNGTVSTYGVGFGGSLSPGGTVSSGGRGLCWVVISADGRSMYATNSLGDSIPGTGTGTVARFALSWNGTPTLLDTTPITASSPAGAAFGTDLTLSADNRYLYVLAPTLGMLPAPDNNDVSHIDVYRVGWNGSLTHIQATPGTLPAGVSGLGAS
jgi:6-phosphogluconolactonase (cycloisomerase 2 family)